MTLTKIASRVAAGLVALGLCGIALGGWYRLSAQPPKPAPDKAVADTGGVNDEGRLQGEWQVVSVERYGQTWKNVRGEFVCQDKTPQAFPVALRVPHRVTFTGRQCRQEYAHDLGTALVETDSFALDAGRAPKWITLTGGDGQLAYGIYSLEGDGVRLCWQLGRRRNLRPADFGTERRDDGEEDPEVWHLKRPVPQGDPKPPKDESKVLPVERAWDGIVKDRSALKQSPPEGIVVTGEAWEKTWRAWRGEEKVPVMDFDKQIALILVVPGPNEITTPELRLDATGNLKVPLPVGTSRPDDGRFGYKIVTLNRSEVKSINGRVVPTERLNVSN